MPHKKKTTKPKKKVIRKPRAPRKVPLPRDNLGTGTFREITTGLAGLRGMLMNRNMPIPGIAQFIPQSQQAQEIAVVRAQANNTIQRIENETNKLLAQATQKQFEQIPLFDPGQQTNIENLYSPLVYRPPEESDVERAESYFEPPLPPRRRGRPKGSKNRPKLSEEEKRQQEYLTAIREGTSEFENEPISAQSLL